MRPARLGPGWWLTALAAVAAFVVVGFGSVRTGGYALAVVLVLGALVRLTPGGVSDGLGVRSRPVDVLTLLVGAVAVAVIFWVVKLDA